MSPAIHLRQQTFLHGHQLPYRDVPLFVGPRERYADKAILAEAQWRAFFHQPEGGYTELKVEEVNATESTAGESRPLHELLLCAPSRYGILLTGPSGSGKTVAAVRAFQELEESLDMSHVLPVWLPTPSSNLDELTDWEFFQRWLSQALPETLVPKPNRCGVEDWLQWSPCRLVFFADLTTPGSRTERLGHVLATVQSMFDQRSFPCGHTHCHTVVVLTREVDPADRASWWSNFRPYRVCHPGENAPHLFQINPAVWSRVDRHLGTGQRTPLLLRILSGLEPGDVDRAGSMAELFREITERHLRTELGDRSRRPTAGTLSQLIDEVLHQEVPRLVAFVALRLLAEQLPNSHRYDRELTAPRLLFQSDPTAMVWLDLLGIDESVSTCSGFLRAPRTDYSPVDNNYICGRGFFGSSSDVRFTHDTFLHYFAGGVGLYQLHQEAEALKPGAGADRILAILTHSRETAEVWSPAIPYLAGRLSRGGFLQLLGRVLFLKSSKPASDNNCPRARLARDLLSGRSWTGWEADEAEGLAELHNRLTTLSFAVERWPEATYSIVRDVVDHFPRLDPWLEEHTRDLPRLSLHSDRAAPSPERLPSPRATVWPEARLHGSSILKVATAGAWIYALGVDGRLLAWSPATGGSARFDPDFGRVVAFDTVTDGQVVVGCRDGRVLLWPADRPWTPRDIYTHPAPVTALDVWPTENVAAIGHQDGLIFRVSLTAPAKLDLWIKCRGPVQRLTRLPGPKKAFLIATADGKGLVSSPPGTGIVLDPGPVPVTVVLPVSETFLLVGWKDGRLTLLRRDMDDRWENIVAGTGRVSGLNGSIVGLATDGTAVYASDPFGRVVRSHTSFLTVATEVLPSQIGTRPVRLGAGRLAWLGDQLVVGDQVGWVRIINPQPELGVPAREDRAVALIMTPSGTESNLPPLAWVTRNGAVRFDPLEDERDEQRRQYFLPEPIRGAWAVGDVLTVATRSDRWFEWSVAGDFIRASAHGAENPNSPASELPLAIKERARKLHVGRTRFCAGPDGLWVSAGSDRVAAVWRTDGSVVAAHISPDGLSAARWIGPEILAVGLVTGAVQVLKLFLSLLLAGTVG